MERYNIEIEKEIVLENDIYKMYDINAYLSDDTSAARAYVLSADSEELTPEVLEQTKEISTALYDAMLATKYATENNIIHRGRFAAIMWCSTEPDYRRQGLFKTMLSYIAEEISKAVVIRFTPTIPESVTELPEDVFYLEARFQHNADNLEKHDWVLVPSEIMEFSNDEFAAKMIG